MKGKFNFYLMLIYSLAACNGSDNESNFNSYYSLTRKSFLAKNAYTTVAFIEQRWRFPGNKGFNESVFYVEKILKRAGFKRELNSEEDGPLTYRIEIRKMDKPTWEPVTASITLANETEPLLEFSKNRNMLAINSNSTPIEGVSGEIIYVGSGTSSQEKEDIKGKIVFGESNIWSLYKMAIEKGAVGVLAYSMPAYNQPAKYTNLIQFQAIPYESQENQKWGILLSYEAKEKLKAALSKGKVIANVKVISKIYSSEELTIIANVRGVKRPEERFVFSAHIQEPGANDNATGVATLAEMARVTAELVQQKKIIPQRTLTFLWGDEILSTKRYLTEDPKRTRGIKWGLSLDMVGEDISKTGGSFLIEKMPDPSAIWPRGEEINAEWGDAILNESEMFPHYFNDVLINRCKQQGEETGWIVNVNPFQGGSDHAPFIKAKIPGLLMWHFTDVYYHTDGDRLEMVSSEEMENVGVSALITAFLLSTADESITLSLIEEVTTNALARIDFEYALSKKAISNGADYKSEQYLLEMWASWYDKALETMSEINVLGSTKKIEAKIAEAQSTVREKNKILLGLLAKQAIK